MRILKLFACAAAALSLCMPCAALAVEWADIPFGDVEAGSPFSSDDVSVTYDSDNNKYSITGGTISNVSIEKSDESSVVYAFDNVTLTGGFSVAVSEEDTFCELILGSGVTVDADTDICLNAQAHSSIRAFVHCDADVHASAIGSSARIQGESHAEGTSLSLTGRRGSVQWTSDADVESLSISTDYDHVTFSGSAMLGKSDEPLEIRITDAGRYATANEMKQNIAAVVSEMVNLSRIACKDENGMPKIRAIVDYVDLDDREHHDEFIVDFAPQSVPVVSSVSEPVAVPTLESSALAGSALHLMTVPSEILTTYYLSLPEEESSDSYDLYFPYPEGVTPENHDYYTINLFHKQPADYDMTEGGVRIEAEKLEFTPYGIKTTVQSLGRFSISISKITPEGVDWETLMGALHEELRTDNSDTVSVTESVPDTRYPHNGSDTITVKAKYDRVNDILTVSGGRLNGVHIANTRDGNLSFGEFGLDSGTYIFENILLLDNLYIFNEDGMDYTVVLENSVGGINDVPNYPASGDTDGFAVMVDFLFSGSVTLENNTTLYANDGHSLSVGMDCGAKFELTGKGKVEVGNGWVNHPTIEDYEIRDHKAMVLGVNALTDDNAEAIRMITDTLENDVSLPPSQFTQWKNGECVRNYFSRMHPDREAFDVDWRYTSVHHGRMVSAPNDPLLVLPGESAGEEEQLLVRETHLNGNVRHYELEYFSSADAYGQFDSAELYFPYPAGLDMNSAAGHIFTVYHVTGTEVERFSTADNTLLLTPYGLHVEKVASLSPFVLTWETDPAADAVLPETGDRSSMPAWLALLGASCLLLALSRRRSCSL